MILGESIPSDRHEELKEQARVKFQTLGYTVISSQKDISKILKQRGSKHSKDRPDLVAVKTNEVIAIDIVLSNITTAQVKHYQIMDKVILIRDFERTNKNIEVWGRNDLEING